MNLSDLQLRKSILIDIFISFPEKFTQSKVYIADAPPDARKRLNFVVINVYEKHVKKIKFVTQGENGIQKWQRVPDLSEDSEFLKAFIPDLVAEFEKILQSSKNRLKERADEFDNLVDLYAADKFSNELALAQLPNFGRTEYFVQKYLFIREMIKHLKTVKSIKSNWLFYKDNRNWFSQFGFLSSSFF